jgi:THO complex subunit 4
MPSGPAPRRNPFDTAVVPGRSLAERITVPGNRSRSLSPGRNNDEEGSSRRKNDVDRYRPTGSRSPMPGRRREAGRRPGGRRDGGGRGGERGGERGARGGRDGRPRKTQEELDAEMENYFNGDSQAGGQQTNGGGAAEQGAGEDIDMIE